MLSTAEVFTIATTLLRKGYINLYSTSEKLLENFQEYSTFKIDEVQRETGIKKNNLQVFFNQTITCMIATVSQYNKTFNGSVLMKRVVDDCFKDNSTILVCAPENFEAAIRGVMVFFAVAFILVFTIFCTKRKHCCLRCCWGYPGPVVPLNMIDSYENRAGFALAFCVIVSSCISILFGQYQDLVGIEAAEILASYPQFVSIFVKLLFAIFVSMLAYPLFVCQSMKNKLVGGVIGALFTTSWIALECYKIYVLVLLCWEIYEDSGMGHVGLVELFLDVPMYICLLLLLIKFIWTIAKVTMFRRKQRKMGKRVNTFFYEDTDWRSEYMYVHVKRLLERISTDGDNKAEKLNLKKKISITLKSKKYKYIPGFKYSTRVVASTAVAAVSVYIIFVLAVMLGYLHLHQYWVNYFTDHAISMISEYTQIPIIEVSLYGTCVKASYWLAVLGAVVFFIIVTMNSLIWYRRHIMKLRKGDRSFLPTSVDKGSLDADSLMGASIKYSGFLVGYSVWAFIIMGLILFAAFLLVSTQIILPINTGRLSYLLLLLKELWPTVVVAIVVALLQRFISRCCFQLEKGSLTINNRSAFHITLYFMFFFNIFLGLVSCLKRILLGVIYGVFFLQRLPQSSLPRSYETHDPGYLAYLGYLLLEHQHANPVLQCFVRLLLETRKNKLHNEIVGEPSKPMQNLGNITTTIMTEHDDISIEKENFHRKRAITRWYLFIFLMRNPSLIKYRKPNSSVKRDSADILNQLFYNTLRNGVHNLRVDGVQSEQNCSKCNYAEVDIDVTNDSKQDEDMVDTDSLHSGFEVISINKTYVMEDISDDEQTELIKYIINREAKETHF